MAIVIKIKPVKVTGKSKQDVIQKITGYSIWSRGDYFQNNGRFLTKRVGHGTHDEQLVRLYSLEKRNRKVEVSKRTITRGKRKGEVEVTRTVVRESGWVAHYYELPITMIDTAWTKQNTRNFTLKLKG